MQVRRFKRLSSYYKSFINFLVIWLRNFKYLTAWFLSIDDKLVKCEEFFLGTFLIWFYVVSDVNFWLFITSSNVTWVRRRCVGNATQYHRFSLRNNPIVGKNREIMTRRDSQFLREKLQLPKFLFYLNRHDGILDFGRFGAIFYKNRC